MSTDGSARSSFQAREKARLPGVEGLLNGAPWSAVDQQQAPLSTHGFPSINTVREPIRTPTLPELNSFALFTPATTAPGTMNSSRRSSIHPGRTSPPLSDSEVTSTFDLPAHSMVLRENGGWLDPDNLCFKLVHEAVATMSLEEVRNAFWLRTPRPEYGENHTSTRGNRVDEEDSSDQENTCSMLRKPVSSHRKQEQDRRVRHRMLQADTFNCTPDILHKLSEEKMSLVKSEIKQKHKEEQKRAKLLQPRTKSNASNKAGKDDQLLAAAMIPHLSAHYTLRLERENSMNKAEIRRLWAELEHRNEPDRKRNAVEADLDNTHDRSSRSHLLPPFPVYHRRLLEPISRLEAGRRHLPPSPSPSCDENSSSFCTS